MPETRPLKFKLCDTMMWDGGVVPGEKQIYAVVSNAQVVGDYHDYFVCIMQNDTLMMVCYAVINSRKNMYW